MSILDSIQAAEAEALLSKKAAAAKARDHLRDVERAAAQEAEALVEKAREQAREKVAAAEKEAVKKLEQLLAERAAGNDLLVEKALGRLGEAAGYIVGRVAG